VVWSGLLHFKTDLLPEEPYGYVDGPAFLAKLDRELTDIGV
jgi:hypothetical protein